MDFEWDENKRVENLRKHGLDFVDAELVFENYTSVTLEDDRTSYPECRFVTIGLLSGRVVVIAHIESETVIRIISMRKANKHEQRRYFEKVEFLEQPD